jgi:hypothetical protein
LIASSKEVVILSAAKDLPDSHRGFDLGILRFAQDAKIRPFARLLRHGSPTKTLHFESSFPTLPAQFCD